MKRERSASRGDGKCRTVRSRERRNAHIPHPARIGHAARQFFTTQTHHHRFAGIGRSFQIERNVALQHHIVGKNRRKLQSTVASCDARIGHFRQNLCTTRVGMHGIGHPIGVRNQRRVEIDPLHMSDVGYLLHSLRNFLAPLARSAVETRMVYTNRSQSRHENAYMGVDCAERIDEG